MVLTRGRGGKWGTSPLSHSSTLPGGREEKCRGIAPWFPAFSRTNTQAYNLFCSMAAHHVPISAETVLCCDLSTVYFEGVFMPLLEKIRGEKLL